MESKDREVKQEFKSRRARELAMTVPFVVGMWPVVQAVRSPGRSTLGLDWRFEALAGAVLVIACVVFHWVNWRCPACRGRLPGGLSVAICRRCGALLGE